MVTSVYEISGGQGERERDLSGAESRKTTNVYVILNPPIHQSTANYRALLSSVLRNGFGVPIRARASTACKLRVHAVRHPGASAAMAADPIPEG